MNKQKAGALQLCPLSAYLEAGLADRLEVIRWFELGDDARKAWLVDHAGEVRAVVTGGHVGCGNELIASLPSLGIIAINGVGVDKVDLTFAGTRRIRVSTTPGVLTDDVADLAVGLLISLLRGIPSADAFVRAGAWSRGDRPLARKVSGSRFGIVGLGHIGAAIAARLAPFGPVVYTGPNPKPVPYRYEASLTALAAVSDVLVLACPASAATYRMVDAAVLAALGSRGYLVNVSRGSVVDESALIAALEAGTIAGAALDVFEPEPLAPDHPLRALDNVIITPHIGYVTEEVYGVFYPQMAENIEAFLAGKPIRRYTNNLSAPFMDG